MSKPEYEWRVIVMPDEDYEHTCEHETEEDAAACMRLVARYGAWGFVTERWMEASPECPTCGHCATPAGWVEYDSCWGFVESEPGMPYMMSQALHYVPMGAQYALFEGPSHSRATLTEIRIKEGGK